MADFSIWSGPSETVPTVMDGRGRRLGAGRWPGVLTPSRCPFSKRAAVTPAHRWRARAHTHPSSILVPHLLMPKGPWAWKEEPVGAVSLSVAFEVNELVHHGSARSIDGCPASCPGQQGRASTAGHGGEQGCQRQKGCLSAPFFSGIGTSPTVSSFLLSGWLLVTDWMWVLVISYL